ncbi:ABC transporter ATP-binding protein [Nonomuraea soli]|uniref:Peptide/nickel transport system ATP-binding protein n=1 Tax=Nonomuraea soli TaxID=1032476 RepID=A0A7W0HT24_9ACTN|nr:ABC transporter ATP-binding protein [Nonomuraea soli]MBA2894595.1 peptide/nickel transport system ATP-binding protein [Nonomuraea soli]
MADALLAVEDLSVEYRGLRGAARAVDRVSFEVAPGEVLGLAGESGCGKSTLALAIPRLLRAPAVITSGSVRLGGRDILELDDRRLRSIRWSEIAMVFQNAMNALNPVMRLGSQFADVIRTHTGLGRARALERAAELCTLVGIDPARLRSYPHELSGGMRQRAALAIALALEPKLVIMDEPTTALDVVLQREIMEEITALRERLGFAVLFITHDISLLIEVADRIAIMYGGRIVEQAPARSFLESAAHPYTRGLLASFPSIDDDGERLTGIPGSPPSLIDPPAGCGFAARCTLASDRCRETPPFVEIAPAHRAACWEVGA